MRITKILLLVTPLLVSACSTTGGSIGGIFSAPKTLKGSIEKSTYLSKDNDFSIALPHLEGSYEYKYMQVKEQYNELGVYISFGPAAFDQSIYRLEVGKKLSPESKNVLFSDAVDKLVENYIQQLESGYKSKPVVEEKKLIQINEQEAFYYKLKQEVPAGIIINNKPALLSHEVIATNYENMAAIVWVQTMIDDKAIKKSVLGATEFAESFKVIE